MRTGSLMRSGRVAKSSSHRASRVRSGRHTQKVVKHLFTTRVRASKVLVVEKMGGYKAVDPEETTEGASLNEENEDESERMGNIKKEVLHPVWKYHDDSADESTHPNSYEPPKTQQHVTQVSTYQDERADECAPITSLEPSSTERGAIIVAAESDLLHAEDKALERSRAD